MHRVPKPKPKKPSLDWFKKMPRRRDPNDERTLLNPTDLQAPPNTPRERNILFGTPRPSQHHRRTHSSTDSSSEDSSRTQRFFGDIVSIGDDTIDDIVCQPLQAPHSSPQLRASVRRLGNPRTPRNKQGIGPMVPLDPEPAPGAPGLEGLALKQAAAVLDPEHPLDLVPVFNAWLATRAKPTGLPLRLKHPAGGEPFLSRSRYSNETSWKEHDAGNDIPEQIAAYEFLDTLASLQSDDWPPAVNAALAALKTYLTKLEPGSRWCTLTSRRPYRQVLDTPELRQRLLNLEWAAAPKALPTQNTPRSEDHRNSREPSLEHSV